MMPTYDDLLDEVQVLRQRLAELAEPDAATKLAISLRLTGSEAKVLAILLSRDIATKDAIYTLAFQHDNGDGPVEKIIDVFICKIRKKARLGGWPGQITTIWGKGYQMSPEMRTWLNGLMNPQPEAMAA